MALESSDFFPFLDDGDEPTEGRGRGGPFSGEKEDPKIAREIDASTSQKKKANCMRKTTDLFFFCYFLGNWRNFVAV